MTSRTLLNVLLLALLAGALTLAGCDRGDSAETAPAASETAPTEEAAPAEEAAEEAAEAPAGEEAPAAAAGAPAAPTLAEGGEEVSASDFQLTGTWHLDMEAALEANTEMSEEERAMMRQLFGSMQMSITFEEGDRMAMNVSMMGEQQSEAGSYEILGRDGQTLSLRMSPDDTADGENEPETVSMQVVDSNTLVMEQDGQQMFLRRTR